MAKKLKDVKVAILATNGFEEVELSKPCEAFLKEGAIAHIIAPKGKKIKSWRHDRWGKKYKVDETLKSANPKNYDALLLPGGVMNPDHLRTNKKAVNFVKHFLQNKKPIAAICHGPWTLIETKKLRGRKMTSYPSIKSDLINAGVKWSNKKVVVDKFLVTSRNPKDLPAFIPAAIKKFQKKRKTNSK